MATRDERHQAAGIALIDDARRIPRTVIGSGLSPHTSAPVILIPSATQRSVWAPGVRRFVQTGHFDAPIAHFVDRRSRTDRVGLVGWPNREKTIAPPESWVTRCRASSSVGPRLQSVEVQPPPNHTRLATTRPM